MVHISRGKCDTISMRHDRHFCISRVTPWANHRTLPSQRETPSQKHHNKLVQPSGGLHQTPCRSRGHNYSSNGINQFKKSRRSQQIKLAIILNKYLLFWFRLEIIYATLNEHYYTYITTTRPYCYTQIVHLVYEVSIMHVMMSCSSWIWGH